jgi:hypothetical protein
MGERSKEAETQLIGKLYLREYRGLRTTKFAKRCEVRTG